MTPAGGGKCAQSSMLSHVCLLTIGLDIHAPTDSWGIAQGRRPGYAAGGLESRAAAPAGRQGLSN